MPAGIWSLLGLACGLVALPRRGRRMFRKTRPGPVFFCCIMLTTKSMFINGGGVFLGLVGNDHFWRGTSPINTLGLRNMGSALPSGSQAHPKKEGSQQLSFVLFGASSWLPLQTISHGHQGLMFYPCDKMDCKPLLFPIADWFLQ